VVTVAYAALAWLSALVLFGSIAWFAALVARRALERETSVGVLATGTCILFHATLVVLFYALAWMHAFRLGAALVIAGALAAAAHLRWNGAAMLARAGSLPRALADWVRGVRAHGGAILIALSLVTVTIVVARTMRAAVAPPLATDATLYHLVRAARWVQSGGFNPFYAPDMWGFVEYIAPGGDIPWAWAMLPSHDDTFTGLASVGTGLELVLVSYAFARILGSTVASAWLGALVVLATPCIGNYLASCYVDIQLLVLFLAASVMLMRATEPPSSIPHLAFATLALALAFQVKFTALLYLGALGMCSLPTFVWRAPVARVATTLLVTAAATLPALPPVLRGWVQRGAPFYPFPVRVGSWTVSAGNPEYEAITTAAIYPGTRFDLREFLSRIFVPHLSETEHTGFGTVAPILFAAGVVLLLDRIRRGDRRTASIFVLLCTALTLAPMLTKATLAYRTGYVDHASRLITVAYAPCALVALAHPSVWTLRFGQLALLVHAILFIPLGWNVALEARPLGEASACVAVLATIAFVAMRKLKSLRMRVASLLLLSTIGFVFVNGVRSEVRHAYYAALNRLDVYDVHRTGRMPPGASEVWQALDGPEPLRIALVFGWNGEGQNLYVTPLLGSSLQNTIHYVTPTRDGSIVDYRTPTALKKLADESAWRQRLARERIDVVVVIPPASIEWAWLTSDPTTFDLVKSSENGRYAAFRVHASALGPTNAVP